MDEEAMRKIRREDWFAAGVAVLEQEGFTAVTIAVLAERLEVTKGSFYHHFGNMEGYVAALMRHWLEERGLAFIRLAERLKFSGRGPLLAGLSAEVGRRAEQAVRAWSRSSFVVDLHLRQLDGLRLKYLESLHLDQGLEGAEALAAARREYALMVGLGQLFPDLAPEDLRRVHELRA